MRWVITNLEALCDGPDIEAIGPDGHGTAFEVKFLQSEDDDFGMIVRSIAGESGARLSSAYSGINYLLFRVYEAAKQLSHKDAAKRRIAAVIIEELAWHRFRMQLQNNWIDWTQLKFLGAEPEWDTFLKGQEVRYRALLSELPSVIAALDRVWIVKQSSGFEFDSEYRLQTNGG